MNFQYVSEILLVTALIREVYLVLKKLSKLEVLVEEMRIDILELRK